MPVLRKGILTNAKKIISPKSKNYAYTFCIKENRHRNASLTVEAALVLPVFFFLFFLLWQCFLLLMFQIKVCEQVTETAIQGSPLGYITRESKKEDVSVWLEPLFWSSVPENKQVRNLWVSCVENKSKVIRVKVTYEFVCEAVFFGAIGLPVEQNFCFYPYRGEGADSVSGEAREDVVYVTEHGTVYHESEACVYLNVTLYAVNRTEVVNQRNVNGEKYAECERCKEEAEAAQVYISKGGNRYHRSLHCPAVKRNVKEIKREEIGTMPACHKCKIKEETE